MTEVGMTIEQKMLQFISLDQPKNKCLNLSKVQTNKNIKK